MTPTNICRGGRIFRLSWGFAFVAAAAAFAWWAFAVRAPAAW